MKNVNVYLRENLPSVSSKSMSVAPNIEERKLNSAVKAFRYEGSTENVVGLLDSSLLGNGKNGLLFTGNKLIYRPSFEDPVSIHYEDITSVEYVEIVSGRSGDKIEISLMLSLAEGNTFSIKSLANCNYKKLHALIEGMINDFDQYVEERQLIPVEDMSNGVKTAYVKSMINMAFDDDGAIDHKEFAEILLLMTRLDLDTDTRFEVRSYMASIESLDSFESLVQQMNEECPSGQVHTLHVSLAKDLINIYLSTGGTELKEFDFLNKHRGILDVNDEEIDLVLMAIKTDHEMIKEDVTDDQIVVALKALTAKAAAVGTPLAAVYLSGSVVGMSAAGLTSGLATLGMGGVLGLSSMATGIGVAVLVGVGAYAGIRKITGTNELTRSKRRELMLNEVIKQTQATISLLVQDINFVTVKLQEYILKHGNQNAQIKKLLGLMSQMTGAGAVLTGKSEAAQSSSIKLRCAKFLSLRKLESLTREPSKAALRELILEFYEEREFVTEENGEQVKVMRLAIKGGLSQSALEDLASAFEAIGYFNTGDVIKGAANEAVGKARERMTGLFS